MISLFQFCPPFNLLGLAIACGIAMAMAEAFLEILGRPTIWETMLGMMQFLGPVWIGFGLGIMFGWAWKPRWASLGNCKYESSPPPSPSAGVPLPQQGLPPIHASNSCRAANPKLPPVDDALCSFSEDGKEENVPVTHQDLEHLCHLVERKDGGPSWKHMMDRSTQDMSYQAWQRDPETGPPQYCSRTVYEDATPELLRDFFWDDEFRMKWDNMLIDSGILEECPTTGAMVVHWTRKFPFFCSDREYIIGRRIWECGRSYYCVTKGVPCESVPRKEKPKRVDLFYSSWYIHPVESRKGNGQMSACEVILFHHEDMGIPWEIAKFGVRQGMWGAVKNIDRGFRAYQKHRATKASLSHHALMAQINTKIDPDYLKILEVGDDSSETQLLASDEKQKDTNIPKLLIIGAVVAIACCLDKGFLTKTFVFGMARKFGNVGRRACPPTN